jgi:hypothetical protein
MLKFLTPKDSCFPFCRILDLPLLHDCVMPYRWFPINVTGTLEHGTYSSDFATTFNDTPLNSLIDSATNPKVKTTKG